MPSLPDGLPSEFLARMRTLLGDEFDGFIASYSRSASRCIRINTLKISMEEALRLLPWDTAPSDILEESRIIVGDAEHIGTHPYHLAGLFYVQEPSAARAVDVLDPKPGMRVLDMCAAPGGKSGAIAARMKGQGILVSNEPVSGRAAVLLRNLQRLGVTNAMVTSAYPDSLAASLGGFFDAVLVDAPCSGEGMFRKSEAALNDWSLESVRACAKRQLAILDSAATTVRAGGTLVYSTCTFSTEENEDVVSAFLSAHHDFESVSTERLYPHTTTGEGQFVAKLIRSGIASARQFEPMKLKPLAGDAWSAFASETFDIPPSGEPYVVGDRVFLINEPFPQMGKGVRVLASGIETGRIANGGRFEPEHALFLAASGAVPRRAVSFKSSDARLLSYLEGNTVPVVEAWRGYTSVTVDGYAVGFGKAVDGVLKNKLPKGIRVQNYSEKAEE